MEKFFEKKFFKKLLLFVFCCLVLHKCVENYAFFFSKFSKLISTLMPFFWGIVFAYILNPGMMFFEKKFNYKIGRSISLLLVYSIFTAIIFLLSIFVIPIITQNISDLYDIVLALPEVLEKYIEKIPYSDFLLVTLGAKKLLQENSVNIAKWVLNFSNLTFNSVFFTALNITSGLLNFVLGIFVSIYFLYDKEKLLYYMKKMIIAFYGSKKSNPILEYFSKVNFFFYNFLVGKLIDSTIIGILCYVGLMLLKIKYSLLLSIIVGITNMIPYFGPFIGAIPAIIITLVYSPIKALWVALFILALQQFDGWYLGPKILGNTVGAKPLSIIFAILVGGSFGGPLGMLIAVPLYRSICILWDTFIDNRLMKQENIFKEKEK